MIPLTRCSERDETSGRVRCYPRTCPHYYVDATGTLNPIVLQPRIEMVTVGDASLLDRNIVSVGTRLDGSPFKFVGARPDINQALGTEQLEYSLDGIRLDGDPIRVNLANRTDESDVLARFDNRLYLHSTRQALRQMVRVPSDLTSFEMTMTLHLTGLRVEDRGGEFWFFSLDTGAFRFRIRQPHVMTLDRHSIGSSGLQHSLIDNGDGTFAYRKWADALTLSPIHPMTDLPAEVLIDADTYYTETSDGYVQLSGGIWAVLQIATEGGSASTADHSASGAIYVDCYFTIYTITRSFFMFDTSAVGSASAASLYLYGYNLNENTVVAMKGTQGDTLTVADFGAHTGTLYNNAALSTSDYTEIAFNAQGITDIEEGGTTYICCREKEHDYDNVAPGDMTDYYNGLWFADEEGTSKDPYLEITEGGGGEGPPLGSLSLLGAGI